MSGCTSPFRNDCATENCTRGRPSPPFPSGEEYTIRKSYDNVKTTQNLFFPLAVDVPVGYAAYDAPPLRND